MIHSNGSDFECTTVHVLHNEGHTRTPRARRSMLRLPTAGGRIDLICL